MNRHLLISVFLLMTSLSFSQENKTIPLSLEEAITHALDSNYTALNARRDMAKALKKKWETTAQGLPQISANISYNNNLKQPVTLLPAEFMGGEPGTYIPMEFGTKQNANAVATLNQLIFDGSYLVGLKAARAFLEFSENANEKTKLEVRKGVINAYGSVLLAQDLVAIFEKNRENLRSNLAETQEIFKAGLEEEESVEQLEITLLDVETQLENASRSLRIAKQMFNLALGLDVSANTILTDDLETLTQQNISLELMDHTLNLEANVDYKMADNLIRQRDLEMQLEKSKAMPNLSAFVNYGTMANGKEFDFFSSEQKWYQSSVLGISMNIPIFSSGMRRASTQQAKIALDQAKTDYEETVQKLRLALTSAKSNYQFAIDKYNNSKRNLALATRIEQKNQTKFTEGMASSFELRQAQLQLYSAQQQYFQSMVDVINEKANLETVLNLPELRESVNEIHY